MVQLCSPVGYISRVYILECFQNVANMCNMQLVSVTEGFIGTNFLSRLG